MCRYWQPSRAPRGRFAKDPTALLRHEGSREAVPEPQLAPALSPAPTGLWARVGVLTPRGRVDLALPADVPVAELVPMVLELVTERSAGGTSIDTARAAAGGGVPQP